MIIRSQEARPSTSLWRSLRAALTSSLRFINLVAALIVVAGALIMVMGATSKFNWATQITNFPAGCSSPGFISAINVSPTCGTPVAIFSVTSATISSNVSVSSNTLTSVNSISLTMPSAGCPCRVHVSYGLYYSTSATNPTINAYVYDATNMFATSQTIIPASGESTGANGSQMSPVTYANSANKTFTLFVESGQSFTVDAAPTSAGQNSWMSATVYPSN